MESGDPVEIASTMDAEGPAFREGRLALLYDLPLRLGEQNDLDALLQTITERLVEIIPSARAGALLLKDDRSAQLLLKAHVPEGRPSVSMPLVDRAMAQRQGFVWQRRKTPDRRSVERGTDRRRRDASDTMDPIGDGITAGMYVPMVWRTEVLGVMCVDNKDGGGAFDADDLRLMVAVAHHAAMATVQRQLQDNLRANNLLLSRLLTNFSPAVREQLLARARHGRLRLGGQRSEVAILESDIRGFTRLSEGMDADDVVDLLNDYFSALVDAVFTHDGAIDKFIGDAVLAVFGSPDPDPERHTKGIRAALAMQAAMAEVSERRRRRGEITCGIGVGVHCGEVLHGFIGSSDRMEFTIIGDAVNRTARYCAAAPEGAILISPELYQRVWQHVDAEPTSIPTKHEGDLRAYRVRGMKSPA